MLYSVDSQKYIDKMPHKKEFEIWKKHISGEDYSKIIEFINEKVSENEVNTAGWMPGSDWTGTIFEPIYYACGKNKVEAGMFFGLIVFNLLMLRPDAVWGFGRFELNGVQISSMTYFRIINPPKI